MLVLRSTISPSERTSVGCYCVRPGVSIVFHSNLDVSR